MSGMHNPPHPGEVLMDGVFADGAITVTEAARQLGVSRVQLSRLLNGRAAMTPEMALRVSQWLGGSAESWLTMQAAYDLWLIRKASRPKVRPLNRAA